MTVKSMTGYASRDGTLHLDAVSYRWTWDIRSVNGKSLDMRLRAPSFLVELEQQARKLLQRKLARGNIQASLQLDASRDGDGLAVNETALQAALALARKLSAEHGLPPLSADGLLALPGVIDAHVRDDRPEEQAALLDAALADFGKALDALVLSRAKEGEALAGILEKTVDEIGALAAAARDAPERGAAAIRAKLAVQVKTLVEGDHGFSEERLHQEALLMAAKADIKEEIDRLEAHVIAARDLLRMPEPVGRRLDFLAQEFNREANTLCSKANDIAITNIGLALKAAIEQFREQVQNVE